MLNSEVAFFVVMRSLPGGTLHLCVQLLPYPTWQLQHHKEVWILKPERPVWEQVHDLELLSMWDTEKCAARQVIDAAVAMTLGVSEDETAD